MSLTKQQQGWVRTISADAGYDYAVIAALIDKESNGKFYWNVGGQNRPALNIEGHYFYKYLALLAPDKLKQAVAEGLAAKKARVVKVPTSYAGRYEFFERMKALHSEAAYMSVSAGVGQIMGDNYDNMCFQKQCFVSAEALFDYAAASAKNQIELIVAFIETKTPLVAAVKNRDVKGIAHYYNGPNYKQNQYDTKLQDLIDRYDGKGGSATELLPDPDYVRIKALGYASTEAFQKEHGLNPDGIIGTITRDKITEVEKARKAKKAPVKTIVAVGTTAVTVPTTAVVVAENAQSVGETIEQVKPAIDVVQQVATGYGTWVAVAVVAVVILGVVGVVLYKKYGKRRC